MSSKRLGTTTRSDELPLFYTDYMTGRMLSFTWYCDERTGKRIRGKYLYIEKNKIGEIVRSGVLTGLQAVDDMRNEAIRGGWKFWLPPPVHITGKDAELFTKKVKKACKKKKSDEKMTIKKLQEKVKNANK